MTTPTLWNIDPALTLLGLGALLACIPLAWWWKVHRQATPLLRLRGLTYVILFLTFDLIIFGAFTRLTDSGLGCPDWPGCYGSASPIGAHLHIQAAQTALPDGPVTTHKAWIEMIHRYLASTVGALIIFLTGLSWYWHHRLKNLPHANLIPAPGWAIATLVWVCMQGAFGALTVTLKLYPAIVTLHLLGGLGLLVLLALQAQRYTWAAQTHLSNNPPSQQPTFALQALLTAALVLTLIQITLGAWVSTNYAVLICTDFPTCHGSWWPEMNFTQGFTLLRPLGFDDQGSLLSVAALTAIHYTHRLMAYAVIGILLLLGWRLWLFAKIDATIKVFAWGLWSLTLWQLGTGLSNIILEWPIMAALMHTAGAALLLVTLCLVLSHFQLSNRCRTL
jgi:cytochrome c oxidase assembly protein subunit 15